MKLSIIFLLFSQISWAAFSNYNSILVGDLAAGLSGAGTAVLGDTSSASFYNPALLSPLRGSSFSAAVGIYKKFDTTYDESEDWMAAPLRVNKGYFRSLPSATGNVIEWGDYKLALSIITPDYSQFSGNVFTQPGKNKNVNYTDESLWVGGSIARQIDLHKHVGLTIYYTARNYSYQVNEREQPTNTDLNFQTFEKRIKENSIVPIIGYYEHINDKWAWGTSYRFSLAKIAGKASAEETSIIVNGGTITTDIIEYDKLKSEGFIPARWNLGVSYLPDTTWLLAFDVNLHEGYSYNDVDNFAVSKRVIRKPQWNISFGGEKTLYDWLKIRAGIFTNFSAHPNPDISLQAEQEDHVDMLGFSANLVFVSEKKIAYTFGGYYTGGWGRSMQESFGQYTIVTKKEHVFTMLVGTAFYF